MNEPIHPTESDTEFLNLVYHRFFDLYDEMMDDNFWSKAPIYRLSRIKDIFAVYSEALNYPPIAWVIDNAKRPNFSVVGKDLFKFIRHVLLHFPFFDEWDAIWIKRSIVNLYSKSPQFIDRYLSENEGKGELKYRFWEEDKKRMTYVSIKYPTGYTSDEKIFLKNMLEEKAGVKFSMMFMDSILAIQIEEVKDA